MEMKFSGHIKFSVLSCCYQSQVAQMLEKTDPSTNFPGGEDLRW
jgi:hypothetical protein